MCIRDSSSDEESPGLPRLLRVYAGGSEALLRDWIKKVHRFARTLPDPSVWYDQELSVCDRPRPAHWEDWLMSEIGMWRDRWLAVLKPLLGRDEFVHHAFETLEAVPGQGFRGLSPTPWPWCENRRRVGNAERPRR